MSQNNFDDISKRLDNFKNRNLNETKFERITDIKESSKIIVAIIQDRDGFLWFATTFGLLKYDGYTFQNISFLKDSLSLNNFQFTSLYIDKEGVLWVGSQYGIILYYDKSNDKFININSSGIIKPDNVINSLAEDNYGNILIGTDKDGLKVYNKGEKRISNYFNNDISNFNLSSDKQISSLSFTNDNLLFIGTKGNGLYILDNSSLLIKNISTDTKERYYVNSGVNCIFNENNGTKWIGTNGGLFFYDETIKEFKLMLIDSNISRKNYITSVCQDKNGNYWIARKYDGLVKLDKSGTVSYFKFDFNDLNSISNNQINCLYIDKSNVLWIGTNEGGICKLDLEAKKFFTISSIFQNEKNYNQKKIYSLNVDASGQIHAAGMALSGTYNFEKQSNGILKFKDFTRVNVKNNNFIKIIENEESIFYITRVDILEYKKKSNYSELFYCLGKNSSAVLYKNEIFLGTLDGVNVFDFVKKEFIEVNQKYSNLSNISQFEVISLFVNQRSELWIGTFSNGVFRYELENNNLTHYKNILADKNSISDNQITSFAEDKFGNLWIGTQKGGINKYDFSQNNFESFGNKNGINGYITSIIEDKQGFLWLGSNHGLYKFDPEFKSTIYYNSTDGVSNYLVDWVFNGCKIDSEGTLYFPCIDGLTYFNPSEIKDNPFIPNIVLTDFQIFNVPIRPSPENPFLKKNITVAKDITLSYKENVFSFEFAALIYNNPSKNQYAYKMEGFDKDWVYSGTRRNVTYTNLDPGDYTFRVKGSNNDGIWNEEGTSIKITITPPWWQTWWIKSCGVALIFMTVGFGFKKRINKLKKEKLAQEEFSRKLLASQESERKRIANELHDSIAHDILILKNNALIAMNNTKEEDTKSALNEISEQSSSTLNEVRSISYNLHPHQIEALGITKAIKSMIDKVSKSTNIKFILEEDVIDNLFTEENEVYIFRVIQESINNIIKHSSASEAIIKITRKDDSVSIIISDNGKGFSLTRNVNKNSLGLSGISERVKMLGGTMKIESEKGEGTRFKIDLPYNNLLLL